MASNSWDLASSRDPNHSSPSPHLPATTTTITTTTAPAPAPAIVPAAAVVNTSQHTTQTSSSPIPSTSTSASVFASFDNSNNNNDNVNNNGYNSNNNSSRNTTNNSNSNSNSSINSTNNSNGVAHSFPPYDVAAERPSSWFQRVLNRFSASHPDTPVPPVNHAPPPPFHPHNIHPHPQYHQYANRAFPNQGNGTPDMNGSQPPSKHTVSQIPLARQPPRMKFLERGADDHFCEKALTRKEVFDLVVQLSTTSVTRDRRGYRHGHASHTALGARPTRSDNVYHTPSQSPLPSPTRGEAGGGAHGGRGVGVRGGEGGMVGMIGEAPSKSMAGPGGGHTGGGGGRGSIGNRLTFRDMRQIDPKFSSKAAIWVREEAMLVNLENIRAIILHDRLFLFDPDSEAVRSSIWHIEKTLAQNVESNFNPFEFRALEGILIHTCLTLESDLSVIEPMLRRVLSQLPLQINNESLESLHKLEQRLKEYEARARKVQQAIQAVLDDDEDMADMYLSEKQKRPGVARHILSHNDVEMLLETYLQQVDDISSRAELLQQAIDDTENLVEMHLDAIQNRVLLMNLMTTSVTAAFSFGALLSSVLGMNVAFPGKSNHNKSTALQNFLITCGVLVCMMVLIFVGIILWCQKKGLFSGKLPGQHRKSAKKQAMQLGAFGEQQEHQQYQNFSGGVPTGYSMPGSSTSAPWQMSSDPVDLPSVPFGSSGDTSMDALFSKSVRGRQHGTRQKRRFDWIPNIPAASRLRSTSALAGQQQHDEPLEHRNNHSRLRLGMSARFARRRERQNRIDMGINYDTLPVTHRDITDDKPHAL